ncbi:virulence factor SrfB [Achromobacter sp. LC458]|uniref:virulence factor SrfB n=1 Tax=Achromobacter sp. LC458 TaxID=1120623 RepID=UPI0011680DCE|nr:virulence factor SrfB [Achromobacter sp. LC458]TRM53423.1 virulence factor SrfB [Achromobacter sp. LC458]
MLPKVDTYTEIQTVDLFGDTGIQFLDLAVTLDLRREPAGQFALLGNGLLARLFEANDGTLCFESEAEKMDRGHPAPGLDDVSMKESLDILDGLWLPVPFFRYLSPTRFDQGPNNWSRLRIVRLATPDEHGHTHRLTLAFDTRIMPKREGVAYLAPNDEDLRNGQAFRLAVHLSEMRWFLDLIWVKEWLAEVFKDKCVAAKRELEDIQSELAQKRHIAHYLNLLSLLRGPAPTTYPNREAQVAVPTVKVKLRNAVGAGKPIAVDLVLDVGNSRTCGILVEDPEQNNRGLHGNTHLVLRDMSAPEQIYDHPFESRVEFAKINLGLDQWSMQSGRHDAFAWGSMTRVGTEASKLAALREGTEGSTGLSSPKRYLWDSRPYDQVWRLNTSSLKGQQEPMATLKPLADLIDDEGRALYVTKGVESVFETKYSRSSLMTLMLNEVFTQAVAQINSILYRKDKENAATSRWLRTVILTVPPSTPQVERTKFRNRVRDALGLLWKSMGWHAADYNDDPHDDAGDENRLHVPLPKVVVKWDEATCAQLVYLYTEIGENFGGHPEEFFETIARPGKQDHESITVASIDIGGGTTDLVINEYVMQRDAAGSGSNAPITPVQRFRDGFKVAGDDIVLDVIRHFILPSFEAALKEKGAQHPGDLADRICGARSLGAGDMVLRQQLTLQAFYPLALALLAEYERFDLEQGSRKRTATWAHWLGTDNRISAPVRDFVSKNLSSDLGVPTILDLGGIELTFDPAVLHKHFLTDGLNICKTLTSLSEVVAHYDCDVLLLTGRPSCLPGVQTLIRQLAALPSGRVLPMQNYRSGTWFPFHKGGLIGDPKTTAAVGAMVCWLTENRRLANFYFSPSRIRPLPLIRYFGRIDGNNLIKQADVLYSDIKTRTPDGLPPEDGCIELPRDGSGDAKPYLLNADTRLGYRQLACERWPAAPIYLLGFQPAWQKKFRESQERDASVPDARAHVYFTVQQPSERDRRQGLISDELGIERVEGADAVQIQKSHIRFEMNTLLHAGLGQDSYWLDSGSVKI